ncbi:MAG: translation elongation factor-like protein [Candidatus Omnitrophota bacterium]|nr:MAG: translation elongation factor-like protein [Candidatus Omnitrophota bacterium]
MPEKKLVGKVRHYFDKISVAVVDVEDVISLGDEISIEGHTTNFAQKVESMQIDKNPTEKAKKGQSIGLKVANRVREGDKVFKIV